MANKWIVHVKKTMRQMKSRGTYKKGMGLKQVIKEAKKTWHKHKGGADEPEESSSSETETVPEGGRKRRGGKTQRRRR
jgi:hypothetical protein